MLVLARANGEARVLHRIRGRRRGAGHLRHRQQQRQPRGLHATPYLVSTATPMLLRKASGSSPPALTITASLATRLSLPFCSSVTVSASMRRNCEPSITCSVPPAEARSTRSRLRALAREKASPRYERMV